MRISSVFSLLGVLLAGCGVAMLSAIPPSLLYGGEDLGALVGSALLTTSVGVLLYGLFRSREQRELRPKEGFLIVSLVWILVPVFGALPYLLGGFIPSFTDAYFESVSGFTTTGASILADVESFPRGLLFWRAMTHWLGGMGIIVLALAILPLLGIGGMQLFRAEVAGPTKDKITPRVAETARLLWGVYVLLTVLETVMLMIGGLSFYDALCHSFATIASGGFSTRNASIGAFASPYVEWVVVVFMFLAGTNFALHYAVLQGNVRAHWKDDEFRFFLTILVGAVALITVAVGPANYGGDYGDAIRAVTFSVTSVMSTTGFATADFALWAPLGQMVLFLLLFAGGCAGSTAGGMKHLRVLLSLKSVVNAFRHILFPNAETRIRLNGEVVTAESLSAIGGFVVLYLGIFCAAGTSLVFMGVEPVASYSAVATCMAGCGPGLGNVGPMSTYASLPGLAKWVLDGCMLMGRLEIFTLLVLLRRSFWRA